MNSCKQAIKLLALILAIICSASCQDDEHSKTGQKFHPGHYVVVGPFFNLEEIKHLDASGLQGINKRFLWRTIEPEEYEYSLSFIEEDLDYCSKHNKQLIVFLIDRAYWIKGAVPAYLSKHEWKNDATYWEEGNEFWIAAHHYEHKWVKHKAREMQMELQKIL